MLQLGSPLMVRMIPVILISLVLVLAGAASDSGKSFNRVALASDAEEVGIESPRASQRLFENSSVASMNACRSLISEARRSSSDSPLQGGRGVFWLQVQPLTPLYPPEGGNSQTGPQDKWLLWQQGTSLRGANISQRRVYPELDGDSLGAGPVGPPFTQEDLNRLAEYGANYVNIGHPGLFTEKPPYHLDPEMQANLDRLLAMVEKAGMFAVISFRTGPGRSDFTFDWGGAGVWFDNSYLNDRVWGDPEAQNAWVTMWKVAARRYRQNPIVVGYDLMFEPNSNDVGSDALNDRLGIWDPGEFYSLHGGSLYDWNQLYPRITKGIRKVDGRTPILISALGYSEVRWLPYLQPTGDPRTVYLVHQYQPRAYTNQDWRSRQCRYPGRCDTDGDGEYDDQFSRRWLYHLVAVIDSFRSSQSVPVGVNAFGVERWEPGAELFMRDQMELFEEMGLNHALWAWHPSWEPRARDDDFNFLHGPDPRHHKDVKSSKLGDVIRELWGRNTIFPRRHK